MFTRGLWLAGCTAALYWGLPQMGPSLFSSAAAFWGMEGSIDSLEWCSGGVRLHNVQYAEGSLEQMQVLLDWDHGPVVRLQGQGGLLSTPRTLVTPGAHRWPSWLQLQVSLVQTLLQTPQSDLLWSLEVSARLDGEQQMLEAKAQAGCSHLQISLHKDLENGWQGEIDGESIPLHTLVELAQHTSTQLLGKLQVQAGSASGHVVVREGMAAGDVLIEHLQADEQTLGLSLGMEEGLLSFSGIDGVHLSVSQKGWLTWGKTSLQELHGSVLWGRSLELDLAGQLVATEQKKVRICTRQDAEGWVARLELLKVPRNSAVAEISFRHRSSMQTQIELQHFGPEECAWLSQLMEPFGKLPTGSSWSAQELEALALVDWREGRPCQIDLRSLVAHQVCYTHPLLGTLEAKRFTASLQGPCDLGSVDTPFAGSLQAEGGGLSWTSPLGPALTQGTFEMSWSPQLGAQLLAQAQWQEEPVSLQIAANNSLTLHASGGVDKLLALLPVEKQPVELACHSWQAQLTCDATGSRLACLLQGGEREGHLQIESPLPLSQWWLNGSLQQLTQIPWQLHGKDLQLHLRPCQLAGLDLEGSLQGECRISWNGQQLQAEAWADQGQLVANHHPFSVQRQAGPLLSLQMERMDSCPLDGWHPCQWAGQAHVTLPLEENVDPRRLDLAWERMQGSLALTWAKDQAPLHASWDLQRQEATLRALTSEHQALEWTFDLLSPEEGSFVLTSRPGAADALIQIPHCQLVVHHWRPTLWDLQAIVPSHLMMDLLPLSDETSPALASLPIAQEASASFPSSQTLAPFAKARQLLQRALPSRIQVCLAGSDGSACSLSVKNGSEEYSERKHGPQERSPGEVSSWELFLERAQEGWHLRRANWGPLHLAGQLLAHDRLIKQAQLLSQSGQLVADIQSDEQQQIEMRVSKEGLARLLDELAVWAGSSSTWSKWCQLQQDVTATLLLDDERGPVIKLDRLLGKVRAMPLDCQQIELWSTPKAVHLSGLFCNRGRRDPFHAELIHHPSGTGEILLTLGSEQCRCGYRLEEGRLQILALEGNLCGQVGHFRYQVDPRSGHTQGEPSGALRGTIACDLKGLIPLVPDDVAEAIERLSLGKGVVFEGILNLTEDISLEGRLVGADVEALGAVWDRLTADFYCAPNVLSLTALHIQDPAGEIKAPSIEIREIEPKQWHLEMPLAGARAIQLNRLRWSGRGKRAVKHLVIEEILLENISGPADRPQQWTGKGLFSFENEAPRPALLFLPAELLGNLGLDLALLEPVRGRIHFAFEDGWIRLKEFEDVVSIRNRSRFFLHPDPGFAVIGFDGTLNVRIWMKQFVVLKITQPLNLYLTGNIKDPEISFQHSDKRCALSTSPETCLN